MLIEYLPQKTFIHGLDVRTKLIGFTGLAILVFLFGHPLYNLAVALTVTALALSAGLPFKRTLGFLVPLLPVLVLIMLFSGFTQPDRFVLPANRTVLFYLLPQHNWGLTVGGLLTGCTMLIRLFAMIIASSLVTLTTPIDDFIQLFNKMKLPYEFSFVVATALRFIPTMDRKRLLIIDAQRSRGANPEKKGIIGHIKGCIPIMVLMMINSIMMANNLSMAMLNRGYGCSASRTFLTQISFKRRDYYTCFFIILVVVLGIYMRWGLHMGVL